MPRSIDEWARDRNRSSGGSVGSSIVGAVGGKTGDGSISGSIVGAVGGQSGGSVGGSIAGAVQQQTGQSGGQGSPRSIEEWAQDQQRSKPQTLDEGQRLYEQRKQAQAEAKPWMKTLLWLGEMSNQAEQARLGQQIHPQENATTWEDVKDAWEASRTANRAADYAGRDNLIKEYNAARHEMGAQRHTPEPDVQRRYEQARDRLYEQERIHGNIGLNANGELQTMSYSFGEGVGNVIGGTMGRVIGGVGSAATWLGEAAARSEYAKSAANQRELAAFYAMTGNDNASEGAYLMADTLTQRAAQRGNLEEFSGAYRFFDKQTAAGNRLVQAAKENQRPVVQMGVDVGSTALEMGFDAASGSPLVSMGVRVFGGASQEAREAGAGFLQQGAYGAASASIEVMTEMIGGLKLYGGGQLDEVLEPALREIAGTPGGYALLRAMYTMVQEGNEEVLSDLLQPLAQSIYNGQSVGENYSQLELQDILYDWLLGAAAAFGGAVVESGGYAQDYTAMREMQQDLNAQGVETGRMTDEQLRQAYTLDKAGVNVAGLQSAENRAVGGETIGEAYENMTPEQRQEAVVNMLTANARQVEQTPTDEITRETAQEILREGLGEREAESAERILDLGSEQNLREQAIAYHTIATEYGQTEGRSVEDALRSNVRGALNDTQVQHAYAYGESLRKSGQTVGVNGQVTEQGAQTAKPARRAGLVTAGTFADGSTTYKAADLSKADARDLRILNDIAKAQGVDFVLYESELGEADAEGRRSYIGANGAYRNGVVYLDINAGLSGERTEGGKTYSIGQRALLVTAAHELTHHLEHSNPTMYRQLRSFVSERLGGSDSFISYVKDAMAREDISVEAASREVVARACEEVLLDEDAIRELQGKKPTLWEQIKEWVKDFVKKFESASGEAVEMRQYANELRRLWLDTAAQNAEIKETVLENNAEPLTEIDPTDEAATVTLPDGSQYSVRSMRHDIAEGKMFEDLERYTDMSHEEVLELRKNLERLTNIIALNRDILDMNESFGKDNRPFKPFKPNSDPLYTISLDFSTLCRKRLMTQFVIEKLQTELTDSATGKRGRPLTAEEQLAVRDLMKEYAKQEKALKVACAMCYVEAARLKAPGQIQRFMRDPTEPMRRYFALHNSEFNASVLQAQADFKEQHGYARDAKKADMKPADRNALNKLSDRLRSGYQMSEEELAELAIAKKLPNETYLTAANLATLAEEHPVIYDAYTATIRTATRSKSLEADIPYYYGDSARAVKDKFIEAVNRENGMRFSSWSDFQIQHMLDMMTAVIELSTRHCAMHGYTKFLEQVRIFGKTGMMFNMSGVANGTGLKADGSLDFSPTESVLVYGQDGEYDAIRARDEFPETAGLQCIGISTEHIQALLDSDIIDYIIPYHTSGLNATLRRMAKISNWDDFTTFQNAKQDTSIQFDPSIHDRKTWHKEPVFSEFFDAAKQESNGYRAGEKGVVTMRRAADLYKQMCRERGMRPKFSWGNSKVDADFSDDPNYWKLLIDRKMINQKTGALIEQKPVRPEFDFELIEQMVQEAVDAYDPTLQDRALNYVREHLDELPQRIKDLKKSGAVKKATSRTSKAAKTLQAAPVAAASEANAAPETVQLSVRSDVTQGLNFRDASGELLERVFDGTKKYETRAYTDGKTNGQLPGAYLNKPIGIIQTGSGKAKLVGYWELGNGVLRDSKWLSEHRAELGNDGSEFEAAPGEKKWVYPIKWAERTDPVEVTSHGIRARDISDIALGSKNAAPETVQRSVRDQEYSDAVARGDMETAQQMVDAAAKAAGYTVKAFHGTRSFGFTVFDPSRADDGISLFATSNRRTAETYSGETNRNRVKDRETKNADDLHGEQLIEEAKNHKKRYQDYSLMSDKDKATVRDGAKSSIEWSIRRAQEFVRDHRDAFDSEKSYIMDRLISSLYHLRDSETEADIGEAWTEWEDALWDLKGMDDSIAVEFLDDVDSRGIFQSKNELDDMTYQGDMYADWYAGGPDYIFDNQLQIELNAEYHKGIYELWCKPGRQLLIDSNGENWNQITPPKELQDYGLYGPQRTRDIATAAKALGYDSVLLRDLRDNGGETAYNGLSDVYIFFDASALKSADPVTYDDNGEVIPLSQRFDSGRNDIRFSVRGNLGYHAGDLGKAEHLNIQGRYRGTGHFGTGTYFVGEEEKVTKDSHYGKRPQHAVDFTDYNLFKVRNDRDGYRLHDFLRIVDGGINREWIRPALENQFNVISPTGYYDLAKSKYGEEWTRGDNLLNAMLEYAANNGISVKTLDEYKADEVNGIDDFDVKDYYEEYVKDRVKKEIDSVNAEYRKFMDAVFDLHLLPGFTKSKISSALTAVADYQDVTPRNAKVDSYATVFMKAMGYDGVDVRGTRLDNTEYGSVIYDVKPETIQYSVRSDAMTDREILMLAAEEYGEEAELTEFRDAMARYQNYDEAAQEHLQKLGELQQERKTVTDMRTSTGEITPQEKQQRLDALDKQIASVRGKATRAEQNAADALSRVTQLEKGKALQDILVKERAAQRQRTRAQTNESTRRRDTRRKVEKLAKELQTRVAKPSEKRYIPADLMRQTVDVLQAINLDSSRPGTKSGEALRARLLEMQERYRTLETDETYKGASYDPTVAEMLKNMVQTVGDTPINKMTAAQLESVYNTLRAMTHVIQTGIKVKIAGEERDAWEVAHDMTRETRSVNKPKDSLISGWVNTQLSAQRMFRRLGNYTKNSAWEKVYRMLNDGQLKMTLIQMEGAQIFADLIGKENEKAYRELNSYKDKDLVDVGLTDVDGNSIKISHGMMVSLYMHLLNEQNARHVARGGLTIPDLKGYYTGADDRGFGSGERRAVGISAELAEARREQADAEDELREAKQSGDAEAIQQAEDAVDAAKANVDEILAKGDAYLASLRESIEKQLTDYERDWIAATQELMDGYSKDRLNETTLEVYGIKKARVEHYFPIKSDRNFTRGDFEAVSRNMSLENVGFMKERVEGTNPMYLMDVADVVNTQISNVAQYCGLMPAIRSFNKIWNKSEAGNTVSLKDTVNQKFGQGGLKYVENLIADLQGARRGKSDSLSRFLSGMRGNMAGANLTISLNTALAQAASYPTAAAEIGWTPLIKAFFKGGQSGRMISRADRELIAKYTPLLWTRLQGYSTVELGDLAGNNQLAGRVFRKMRFITGWIQAMDTATVGRLWYAAQYYVDAKNPELQKGSDAYYEATAKVFNDIVEKTQPDYTTMQRPDILRNTNELVRSLTMFMTQRLQNFNIVYDAVATAQKYRQDYRNGQANGVTAEDVKQTQHEARRAVVSQIAAGATIVVFKTLSGILQHALDGYRDDDKELKAESISFACLDMFLDTMASNFLWGGELYDVIESAITGNRYYGLEVNGVQSISDILSTSQSLFSMLRDYKTLSWDKVQPKFITLAKKLGPALGLPIGNAVKLFKGIWLWGQEFIHAAEDGDMLKAFDFEEGVERGAGIEANRYVSAWLDGDRAKMREIIGELSVNMTSFNSQLSSEIGDRYKDGSVNAAQATRMLQELRGMTPEEAAKTVNEWKFKVDTGIEYDKIKEQLLNGSISVQRAAAYWQKYGGMSAEDATLKANYVAACGATPGLADKLSQTQYKGWYNNVRGAGVKVEVYAEIRSTASTDGNSNVSQAEAAAAITRAVNARQLTPAQAQAVWQSFSSSWKTTYAEYIAQNK